MSFHMFLYLKRTGEGNCRLVGFCEMALCKEQHRIVNDFFVAMKPWRCINWTSCNLVMKPSRIDGAWWWICPAWFSHASGGSAAQVQTWKLKANLCLMIRWQAEEKLDWPPCQFWHLVCVPDKYWTLALTVGGSNWLASNKRIQTFYGLIMFGDFSFFFFFWLGPDLFLCSDIMACKPLDRTQQIISGAHAHKSSEASAPVSQLLTLVNQFRAENWSILSIRPLMPLSSDSNGKLKQLEPNSASFCSGPDLECKLQLLKYVSESFFSQAVCFYCCGSAALKLISLEILNNVLLPLAERLMPSSCLVSSRKSDWAIVGFSDILSSKRPHALDRHGLSALNLLFDIVASSNCDSKSLCFSLVR